MHPILFHIGDFFIGSYGLMIVIGLVCALMLAQHLGRGENIAADHFYDLGFVAVLSGFLGARLFFILIEFTQFLRDPIAMILSREGFIFYGGFLTAAAAIVWYIRKKQMPLWKTADIAAP